METNDQTRMSLFCYICQLYFNEKKKFNDHFISEHSVSEHGNDRIVPNKVSDIATVTISSSVPSTLNCGICGSSMKNLAYMTHHILMHIGAMSYFCEVCHFSTISKLDLQNHMRKHENKMINKNCCLLLASGNMHECERCDSCFDTLRQLVFHYVKHLKQMPFKCLKCNMMFDEKKDFIIHNHLHKETLTCDLCHSVFKVRSECLRHVLTHNKSKLFRMFNRIHINPVAISFYSLVHMKRVPNKQIDGASYSKNNCIMTMPESGNMKSPSVAGVNLQEDVSHLCEMTMEEELCGDHTTDQENEVTCSIETKLTHEVSCMSSTGPLQLSSQANNQKQEDCLTKLNPQLNRGTIGKEKQLNNISRICHVPLDLVSQSNHIIRPHPCRSMEDFSRLYSLKKLSITLHKLPSYVHSMDSYRKYSKQEENKAKTKKLKFIRQAKRKKLQSSNTAVNDDISNELQKFGTKDNQNRQQMSKPTIKQMYKNCDLNTLSEKGTIASFCKMEEKQEVVDDNPSINSSKRFTRQVTCQKPYSEKDCSRAVKHDEPFIYPKNLLSKSKIEHTSSFPTQFTYALQDTFDKSRSWKTYGKTHRPFGLADNKKHSEMEELASASKTHINIRKQNSQEAEHIENIEDSSFMLNHDKPSISVQKNLRSRAKINSPFISLSPQPIYSLQNTLNQSRTYKRTTSKSFKLANKQNSEVTTSASTSKLTSNLEEVEHITGSPALNLTATETCFSKFDFENWDQPNFSDDIHNSNDAIVSMVQALKDCYVVIHKLPSYVCDMSSYEKYVKCKNEVKVVNCQNFGKSSRLNMTVDISTKGNQSHQGSDVHISDPMPVDGISQSKRKNDDISEYSSSDESLLDLLCTLPDIMTPASETKIHKTVRTDRTSFQQYTHKPPLTHSKQTSSHIKKYKTKSKSRRHKISKSHQRDRDGKKRNSTSRSKHHSKKKKKHKNSVRKRISNIKRSLKSLKSRDQTWYISRCKQVVIELVRLPNIIFQKHMKGKPIMLSSILPVVLSVQSLYREEITLTKALLDHNYPLLGIPKLSAVLLEHNYSRAQRSI